jgi:glycosyltransferase involved in cell wall biosynthesis
MSSTIRVFYLARLTDGRKKISRFAKSYSRFTPGKEHDLTVIVKGANNQFEVDLITQQFSGIDCSFELVPDSIGVDIHAYLYMVQKYDNEFFCFLNTHSEIVSEKWLEKMYKAIIRPNVGLVGAFGSYESIYRSWEVLYKAQQRYRRGELSFRDAWNFYWILESSRLKGSFFLRWPLRRIFGICKRLLLRILRLPRSEYHESYEWRNVTRTGAPLSFVNKFNDFPNPHIRSNAFLVKRKDLESFQDLADKSKLAANEFECGKKGLSQFFLDQNKKLVVVGNSGEEFDSTRWNESDTFRLGLQSNLLIHDNQTRKFASMKAGTRNLHQIFSWGTLGGEGSNRITLGTDFFGRLEKILPSNPALKYKISVVIPSHNRNSLVDQALFTALTEPYEHLEVVVFDNASQNPIQLTSIYRNNQQVKFYRSETFLSVTESWNFAISQATGDYLIFLGDDDGLLPGFYSKINQIIHDFDQPDIIMSSLYQFFHPGVSPSNPDGLLSFMEVAPEMGSYSQLRLLSQVIARKYVSGSLNTERHFLFQLPAYVVKRDFLFSAQRGSRVFEPPFPDYYLANLLLWKASKIVSSPEPISFQGVSKESFGYTLLNGISYNGFKILNESGGYDQSKLRKDLLPGSHYWNSYALTMERVAESIGVPFESRFVRRYRRIRIVQELLDIQESLKLRGFIKLLFEFRVRSGFFSKLTISERFFAFKVFFLLPFRFFRMLGLDKLVSLFLLKWSPTTYLLEKFSMKTPSINSGIELYRYIQKREIGATWSES